MCGIVGIIKKKGELKLENLEYMCEALAKRGPNSQGIYVDKKNKNVGLGHRRLSIIDLDGGYQPIFNEEKDVVIVFNGEIYNFQELRLELSKNHIFSTKSDTEVILHGYEEWGIKGVLERLEGMFSFIIYDSSIQKTYIARDKFGEKPLYYYENENEILFSSELKGILAHGIDKIINKEALNYYLSLNYIPAPYTIYENTFKLNAGHYLEVYLGEKQIYKYYDLNEIKFKEIKDFEVAKNELRKLLFKSVESRMVADVPMGSFLSGGIDSSIISAIMSKLSSKPINTFSIGFYEKEYDESENALKVSEYIKSNHTIFKLDYKDAANMIDEIILNFDEPFADSSAIPTYFVSKIASEKVKMVLTGDAADEIFGGYEKYLIGYYSEKYKKIPKFGKIIFEKIIKNIPHNSLTNVKLRQIKKVIRNSQKNIEDSRYELMCLAFKDIERQKLLKNNYNDIKENILLNYKSFHKNKELDKALYSDLKIVLEGDMLVKVDRTSMQNSIEARVPYLDSNIVKFSQEIPDFFKIKGKNKKYILKEAFKDLLPKEIFNVRKSGFGVPIDYWFENNLKEELLELLCEKNIKEQNIFEYEYIKRILNEHMEKKENHKEKLWNIYVFQKWYIYNFKKKFKD